MNGITFEILKNIAAIIGILVGSCLIPAIRAKVSADQLTALKTVVDAAVLAAQQIAGSEPGGDRKEYARGMIYTICKEKKITITDQQIDTLIEAAVKAMKIETAKGATV